MIQSRLINPIHTHNSPIIRLVNVVKEYPSLAGNITALNRISLTVDAGEFITVSGKSGSGKTTLLNMVAALDRTTAGEIWVNGVPVHRLSNEKSSTWRGLTIGVVFQTFELMPTLNLLQNVMMPMDFAGRFTRSERKSRAMQLLNHMEIAGHALKQPGAISGGQQQRVAIARALANDPPIIVADEPTGSLDSVTSKLVMDVFQSLADQGKTVVVVTHDRDIAARAKRCITLSDGRLIEDRS